MNEIHVCSLARLDDTIASSGASHVVTLMGATTDVARPSAIEPDHHLIVAVNDISEPMEGYVLAGREHVVELIAFIGGWDGSRPMVIHCFAGISRSTAAAFIALCQKQPGILEAQHAARLRDASPTATPNRHLVSLADALLERDGRMIAAIADIGRGETANEGTPFRLMANQ